MNLSGLILRTFGWRVRVAVPDYPKLLICVAPHTSNWDFILCELAIRSVGRHSGFLMKESWFFWPLGCFFRSIGGVAVPRRKPGSASLTEFLINKFRTSDRLTVAITPEGTRSRTTQWHTGFLRIAQEAGVPLALATLDFRKKEIAMEHVFKPTGNIEADMRAIKDFYKPYTAKYPEKFSTE